MFYSGIPGAKVLRTAVRLACAMAMSGLAACSTSHYTEKQIFDDSIAVLRPVTGETPASATGKGRPQKQRKGDHPDEWAKLRALQQASEDGKVKPDGLIKAIAQRRKMLANAIHTAAAGISKAQWTFLGPGNIGGRIRPVVIHPVNTNNMWIGSVSGGIWKTADGGNSWSPVNDFMGNLAVSAMAIDTANPNTMYAGTGEGFYNGDGVQGYGVFKSTDGGSTWEHLSSTTPSNDYAECSGACNWYYVNRLAVSSNRVILAATSNGYYYNCGTIYRSADNGATWSERFTGRVLDVLFDPDNPDNALANAIDYNSTKKQWETHIIRSSDAGQSWSIVKTFIDNTGGSGRIELAYAPSDSRIVYASLNNSTSNSGAIYKSGDGGATWALVSTPEHLKSQGDYANAIWVSPSDANFVVIGGVDAYRSRDGGITWAKISDWQRWPDSAHADFHAIVSHPGFNGSDNRAVFFGNDGGIWKASDISTTALARGWTDLNNSLGITQFYGGAGNLNASKIIGGSQDNGHLMYTGSLTWVQAVDGDGGFAAVDPADSSYMYGEYAYLDLYRSTDGGKTYYDICSGISEANSDYCGGADDALFIAPFGLDPNNPNTMLAGAASLWRSTNVKALIPSWRAIKARVYDAIGNVRHISAMAVAEGNSDIIWVGYTNGNVYHTTNGTSNSPVWTKASGLPARYVTRILIDKDNNNRVYAAFGGYDSDNIYMTSDGGVTWKNIAGNIPYAPVRSIVRHPANADWLYAGTEVGVYASENGGTTWSTTNDGPANVPVDELFWYSNNQLVAATHGRGMFMLTFNSDNCVANLSNDLRLHVPAISYNGQLYWADFQYAQGNDITLTDAGLVTDTGSYSSCASSALSPDLKLHIPAVIYNGTSYWADFQYSQGAIFTLTDYGANYTQRH